MKVVFVAAVVVVVVVVLVLVVVTAYISTSLLPWVVWLLTGLLCAWPLLWQMTLQMGLALLATGCGLKSLRTGPCCGKSSQKANYPKWSRTSIAPRLPSSASIWPGRRGCATAFVRHREGECAPYWGGNLSRGAISRGGLRAGNRPDYAPFPSNGLHAWASGGAWRGGGDFRRAMDINPTLPRLPLAPFSRPIQAGFH